MSAKTCGTIVFMSGQHIEREARYAQTGMTGLQRDQLIWDLRRRGWTQAKIAKYLSMTQPAVKYALDRLMGKPRRTVAREFDDEMEVDPLGVPEEQW
ncbi:MAG: hypothetical protein QOC62_1067 [Mycobacterium sp.]|nr:hypothetical protein [Mycobacterium sp.]